MTIIVFFGFHLTCTYNDGSFATFRLPNIQISTFTKSVLFSLCLAVAIWKRWGDILFSWTFSVGIVLPSWSGGSWFCSLVAQAGKTTFLDNFAYIAKIMRASRIAVESTVRVTTRKELFLVLGTAFLGFGKLTNETLAWSSAIKSCFGILVPPCFLVLLFFIQKHFEECPLWLQSPTLSSSSLQLFICD